MRSTRARAWLWGAVGVIAFAALWELYKFVGPADGWLVGAQEGVTGSGIRLLPRASDQAMPHVWEMFERIVTPVTRAPGALPLGTVVLLAAVTSLGVAALGWLVGVVVGFALALLMLGFRIAERAVLPFVILSQTVPLIALAPLIRNWGSRLEFGEFSWESWMSVVIIASYLAFFPVAVGALRGLQSPDVIHLELMRTYAVGWWPTLFRLRLPASVPFLIPALRLAAANAVVGTVVAEISVGFSGGIGRLILETAVAASSDPAKPWAPIFGAVLLGLVAAGFVALLAAFLTPFRRQETVA
ncbi:ABC transporter permease [Agromyces sp. MMS24-JH15]|uniref:ABC transporter permease n=1 Tax=Agromyces sp. MMS24-JH15 TaxID=3243765 RepID=UPI0037479D91